MAATVYYSPRTPHSSPSKGQPSPCSSEDSTMGVLLPRSWPMSHPIHYVNSNNAGTQRRNASVPGIQRPKIPRPLSMPSHHLQVHANALATLNSYCLDAEEISPALNQCSPGPLQPTRVHSDNVSTPTPTCAPWISNVKAIKKIQSKIGIGGVGQDEKAGDSNLSPLRFHSVHGENIQIFQGGTAVRRVPSLSHTYCKAIVFSDRAVKVNERICVKVIGTSNEFAGGIRFGFTNQDPSTLRYSLPDRAIPELAKRQGFWAKALLGDNVLKNEAILFYYVNHSGKVRYGINGKKVGTFLKYVDTRKPLWALVDVYGNTTAIELVDPKAHLNNSRKSLEESSRNFEEVDSAIGPSMNSLNLTSSTVIPHQEPAFNNLQFHPTCGMNIQMNKFRNVAWRNSNECGNAYVFTSRPIEIGETIVVKVLETDESLDGSMAFGLTSADPQSISPKTLPEDSYYLVDRPEYWIFKKDAIGNLSSRDELAFNLTSTGALNVSKNHGPHTTLMYVDLTCPLYAFFDLFGSTYKVSLLGSILPKVPRTPHQETSPTLSTSRSQRTLVSAQCCTPSMPRSSNFVSSPSRQSVKQSPPSYSPVNMATPPRQLQFQNGRSPLSSPTRMTPPLPPLPVHEKFQFKQHSADFVPQKNVRVAEDNSEFLAASSRVKSKEKGDGESKNWSVDCVACCKRPVNSLFSPCGHLTMCYDCAYDYWNARQGTCCPICRKQIADVIPISKAS